MARRYGSTLVLRRTVALINAAGPPALAAAGAGAVAAAGPGVVAEADVGTGAVGGPGVVAEADVGTGAVGGPGAVVQAGAGAVVPVDAEVIAEVLRAHGEPDARVSDAEVAELVEVLGTLFSVCAADDDDTAAAHLNALFARYAGPPRLTDHDGTRWHLHLDRDDDGPLADWVATSAALAFAEALAEHGRDGWGICRADGCGRVFLRGGPGRRRTACSDRCATRERVRAHRRRRRSGPTGADE